MTTGLLNLSTLDLDAYLRRIHYSGDLNPSHPVLEALHLAHASHIPFENLDILLGRSIRLDVESLQAKMVKGGRGGYCFEQNLLFAAVLERLGFSFTQLAARVRYRTRRVLPRTHMLLLVHCDGSRWVADVGFGLEGLLLPLPFDSGQQTQQFGRIYRIATQHEQSTLQMRHSGSWTDLYSFSMEPQQLADYEMANYYTSTHPDSRFVQTLTVQLPRPDARKVLRNRELSVDDGKSVTNRTITGDVELLEVLDREFGLRFPIGTRFPLPGISNPETLNASGDCPTPARAHGVDAQVRPVHGS
jgi:N-hydroxyarylamine O-acetyltransferase